MIGDEGRYYMYAQNLLQGFYSPPPPDIYLWNGPGYPLFLMPFVFLKASLIVITLANAFLQYLSVVFLFKSILKITNFRKALLFGLFWAFSFGAYHYMHSILTESLTFVLISLFVYFVVYAFRSEKKIYIYLSGFILGYIALTKIIFGYVIIILLLGSALLWIMNRKKIDYKKSVLISTLALITVMPYLIYTQSLTGRFFYWGNSGGMSLYWMSTPHEGEYGDWNGEHFLANNPNISVSGHEAFLSKHHQEEMNEILKYKGVNRDDAFKRFAMKNIKQHPKKYLKNIFSNMNRMFFDFPNTYSFQYPSRLVWYSGILFTLMLFSFVLTIVNWRQIDYSIRFLFMVSFAYLGGSMLLSADFRLFSTVIPVLLIWVAYILHQFVLVKTKFGVKR